MKNIKRFLVLPFLCGAMLITGCSSWGTTPDKYAEEQVQEVQEFDRDCYDDYSGLLQINKEEMIDYLEYTFYDVCGIQPYILCRTSMQGINGMNEAWEYWDTWLGKFENQNFVAFCYIDKIENGLKTEFHPNCCWSVVVGRDVKLPEGMTREDLQSKMDMMIDKYWRSATDWQRVELPFIGFAAWYDRQFEEN